MQFKIQRMRWPAPRWKCTPRLCPKKRPEGRCMSSAVTRHASFHMLLAVPLHTYGSSRSTGVTGGFTAVACAVACTILHSIALRVRLEAQTHACVQSSFPNLSDLSDMRTQRTQSQPSATLCNAPSSMHSAQPATSRCPVKT